MATQVNVLFSGICLFLTDTNRVIIGAAVGGRNCADTADIPRHYAYLTYLKKQRDRGKTLWKSNGAQESVLLSGLIEISGNFVETDLQYPGGTPKLPNVVVTKDVAPAYTPLPSVVANDPGSMDPAVVAARVDLPPGTFQTPTRTREFWHFFPQKTTMPVRQQIAQAVKLVLHVNDDSIRITERPLAGGGRSEVVALRSFDGNAIHIGIGNSSEPDITPKFVRPKPAIGPDHDFELHWNLFDLKGDQECPPVSYNEGTPGNRRRVTLGGGNCPPTQWP